MTSKSEFTEQEWEVLREGPPTAGMIAATASSGGTFRESWALAKALTEARQHHGESELLDAIAAEKPHAKRFDSPQELETQGLAQLHEAVALLQQKATPDEVDAYKKFTLAVAGRVAEAHKEGGQAVSPEEQQAIDKITASLDAS
jgi:ribosomal protein S12 methylthiotransferase accessory factor YcaO